MRRNPSSERGIVITRPKAQVAEFAALLQSQGARAIHFPTIQIAPPEDFHDLDHAINRLSDYKWIIFTSANGVNFFLKRLRELGKDVRELKGIKICSIGPATAGKIGSLGIRVDLLPDAFISEGVVKAFQDIDIRGSKILLPRAETARDVIPEGLSKLGAQVDVATTYRTVTSGRKKSELEPLIKQGKVDVITFTSPSTVTGFFEIMGRDFLIPPQIKVACIGPVTAETAKKTGLTIDIMQERYTIPGLVNALVNYFKGDKSCISPPIGQEG